MKKKYNRTFLLHISYYYTIIFTLLYTHIIKKCMFAKWKINKKDDYIRILNYSFKNNYAKL